VLMAKLARPLCSAGYWKTVEKGRELVRVAPDGKACKFVVRVDWSGLDEGDRVGATARDIKTPITLRAAIPDTDVAVDIHATVPLKTGQEPLVVLKTGEPSATLEDVAFSFDIWTSIVTDEFARRFKVGQTWGAPTDAKVTCDGKSIPVDVRVHAPPQVGAPPTLWLGVARASIAPYAGRGCTFSVTLAVPVVHREGSGSQTVKWVLEDRRLGVPEWLAPAQPPVPSAAPSQTNEPQMSVPPEAASPAP
jgi:hypothetical protein